MGRHWKKPQIHSVLPPMNQMPEAEDSDTSDTEPETESDSVAEAHTRGKSGRPKGSNENAKEEKVTKHEDMLNTTTNVYRVERIELVRNGSKIEILPKGRMEQIIDERKKEYEYGFEDSYVSPSTIFNRFAKKRFEVHGRGTETLALHLEAALVDLLVLVTLADMNKPFSCGEGMKLANDLLHDTATWETIIAFKQKMKYNGKGEKEWINKNGYILGEIWWNKFLKRNRRYLTSAKGQIFSLNRENLCIYSNFLNM